jgi:hypothetical protein
MANATRVAAAMLTLFPALAAEANVPKANCRASDKAESGLQGLTTQAEIDSGAAKAGFNCNADIVGQYQGEGASWQLTAWKNCAYFDQRLNSAEANPGTVVVDVSDPKNPKPTVWLGAQAPAFIDPWESLKVNAARQLLGAGQRPTGTTFPGTGFAIYDISQDCAHPTLKSSIDITGSFGHTGQWAPDGNTYYITPLRNDISIEAIDTKDPTKPKLIPCFSAAAGDGCGANGFFTAPAGVAPLPRWHDLEFSKDGNTAYITMFGTGSGPMSTAAGNGLLILDVSDFQQRRANPMFRVISSLTWDDGSVGAQNALPITIKGKPYILFADEGGAGTAACQAGKSGAGFPRLIDISDPKNPKIAARLKLDIHEPANCTAAVNAPVQQANATAPPSSGFFSFSCHYCNVDDADNAKLAACNCFAAGLRVFDISDVNNVKEIAYVKPPAQGTKSLPGSQYANSNVAGFVRNFDWATSKPSFPKDRGMTSGDLWTTSQDNGFMVVNINQGSSGGGCASADASIGGLIVFGLVEMLRRRKLRRRS